MAILVAVGIAAYYGWMKRDDILFQGEENFEVNDETDKSEDELEDVDDDEDEDKPKTEEEKKEEEKERNLDDLDEDEMDLVSASDCDNECENWDEDEEEFEVCQEICGLRDDSADPDKDCEILDDTEADICYRREAIDEKDFSLCKKIGDESLRKNCENRVLEEILEQ